MARLGVGLVIGSGTAVFELLCLAARWALGLFGAVMVATAAMSAGYGTFFVYAWAITDLNHPGTLAPATFGGLFPLFLCVQGFFVVTSLEGQLARHFLGPSRQEALEQRMEQLAVGRAGVVDVVHDERRRIERDLHDGVQQQLVALGMLLGRARRSGDARHADELLGPGAHQHRDRPAAAHLGQRRREALQRDLREAGDQRRRRLQPPGPRHPAPPEHLNT